MFVYPKVPTHLGVPAGGRGPERLHVLRLLGPGALPDAGHVHGPAQAVQRVHGPGGGQLQLSQLGHHQPGALPGGCGRRGTALLLRHYHYCVSKGWDSFSVSLLLDSWGHYFIDAGFSSLGAGSYSALCAPRKAVWQIIIWKQGKVYIRSCRIYI